MLNFILGFGNFDRVVQYFCFPSNDTGSMWEKGRVGGPLVLKDSLVQLCTRLPPLRGTRESQMNWAAVLKVNLGAAWVLGGQPFAALPSL